MNYIYKLSFAALLLIFLGACENTDLDLLDDPSSVTPENAELDLVYNNVMLEFTEFCDEASDETMPYTRIVAMTGGNTYNNQDQPTSFDFLWEKAYSEIMPDINLVISLAEEGGFTLHSGSAKVIKAYILFVLVDLFGDIPYSQAFQGVANPSPPADDDAAVYEAAFQLLEAGISDLNTDAIATPANDLYYGGDADKWIKLANSLKLRYYVNTRLVSANSGAINGLIGNVISSESDDWQFEYGNQRANPDSRHPLYEQTYEADGAEWYQSNYYMWQMFSEKETEDPRIRYYFYRQDCDETDEDLFTLDCPNIPYPNHWPDGLPWCTASGDFGDPAGEYGGYWGRDHGNDDGIPPDDFKRTAWGLYPAGGKFDADDCVESAGNGTDGARGAGIQPIILASFVDFMLAEAALTMGINGNARDYLQSAVEKSIAKVMGFSSRAPVDPDYEPTAEQVTAYVDEVLGLFDNAASDEDKLSVIMNEYRLATYGAGVEPYNAYRRTGLPKGLQPTRDSDPGTFARLFWYPSNYVNRNASASQREITQQVFWDTNPPGFIN